MFPGRRLEKLTCNRKGLRRKPRSKNWWGNCGGLVGTQRRRLGRSTEELTALQWEWRKWSQGFVAQRIRASLTYLDFQISLERNPNTIMLYKCQTSLFRPEAILWLNFPNRRLCLHRTQKNVDKHASTERNPNYWPHCPRRANTERAWDRKVIQALA
jgi:hypothetical protein